MVWHHFCAVLLNWVRMCVVGRRQVSQSNKLKGELNSKLPPAPLAVLLGVPVVLV